MIEIKKKKKITSMTYVQDLNVSLGGKCCQDLVEKILASGCKPDTVSQLD